MRKKSIILVCLLLLSITVAAQRDTVNFCLGWQFRAGSDESAAWRSVNLPHDFQIEQPWVAPAAGDAGNRNMTASTSSILSGRGFKAMGTGWYRKSFTVPQEWNGRRVLLDFGGIMLMGDVYLNGERIGGTDYGYVGFGIDITGKLRHDTENEIKVWCSTGEPNNSRWYSGGGLFRSVNVILTDRNLYFGRHPLAVTTDMDGNVGIQARITYEGRRRKITVLTEIIDADGVTVASAGNELELDGRIRDYEYDLSPMQVPGAHTWSCEDPYLYTLRVSLLELDGTPADQVTAMIGMRTIEYSPEFGLKLNGRKVLLKGIANHSSLGALGAAAYPRAIEKRVKLLKSFGFNHIRCSHNPYSKELLDICDREGILVVDELYDKWITQHAGFRRDFTEIWQYDIEEFITRDRNHPCVVMWSLGNELQQLAGTYGRDFGITQYRLMHTLAQRFDDTRPYTVAMHPRYRDPRTDSLPHPLALETDIASYNYRYMYFPGDGERFPNMIFYQSEASVTGMPGNYWEMDRDKVIGLAYWGAIDYLGESQGWPAKGWAQGVFDISLEPKPTAYLVKSMFTNEPVVHIGVLRRVAQDNMWNGIQTGTDVLDENWNLTEGSRVSIYTYTNAAQVELRLNGKSLGVKDNPTAPNSRGRILWRDIEWQAGKLEAIALNDGKEVACHTIQTTGKPLRLVAEPDQQQWRADGIDLQHIRITAVDSKGRRVPDASQMVSFSVSGPATIVAVDNGDIASGELHTATQRSLYNGSALVILRATDTPGKITLTASADDLKPARTLLETNK